MPARENPEQDEKEEEDTIFEQENGDDFWSMSGDFKYRHHKIHRSKLHILEETTMIIPKNTRQSRKGIDNAPEHTLNDYWNDKREVLLSEEWIGTARFQTLTMKLSAGYKWVNGRPTKIQTTARLDTIWPEEWPRVSKDTKERRDSSLRRRTTRLQEARPQEVIFEVLSEDTENLKVISTAKLDTCVVLCMPFSAKCECSGETRRCERQHKR